MQKSNPIMILRVTTKIIYNISKGLPFRILELLGQLFPENVEGCIIRGFLYRPFLKRCGKNFQVGLNAKLEHPKNIEIGDDVYIGHGCWISGLGGGIIFHDQVMLGPYVTMVSADHLFEKGSARFANRRKTGTITVGYGSWIASHAIITSGVKVGKSCLIAAGAVITKDVADGSICAGVPGKNMNQTHINTSLMQEG